MDSPSSCPPARFFRAVSRAAAGFARSWKVGLAVLGAIVLVSLAAQLDPQHDANVVRDAEAKKIRLDHEAKLAALTKKETKDTERISLDFTKLSFTPEKDPVDPATNQPHYDDQTPALVKSYNGRPVRIRGYMLPVRMEGNEVREFMVMANQMSCCFGNVPRFWEFVVAKKTGDAVPNLMDTPLTFEGILHVGDVYEKGYWTQFYTLECTAVIR